MFKLISAINKNMKTLTSFFLCTTSLVVLLACSNKSAEKTNDIYPYNLNDTAYSLDTRGYSDDGQIITQFDCPDSKDFFPPVNIKLWDKVPVVNGRLPTYKETLNGTSIHTYKGKNNREVWPYAMNLPRLAYCMNSSDRLVLDSSSHKIVFRPELVVVIQIVQTAKDTLVGYRYLTGGVGGSSFRDFHFLTKEEVDKEVGL